MEAPAMPPAAMQPAATGGTKPAKFPTKLRRNYPRSRNGCLTCRQRKKKCDELKPECTGCVRNRLPCEWPAAVAKPPVSAAAPASATAAPDPRPDVSSATCLASATAATVTATTTATVASTPSRTPSSLSLYQHKSHWQTYLPVLATWDGVEGGSVNINNVSPAYDEAGRRTGVNVATATATDNDSTDKTSSNTSTNTSTGNWSGTLDDETDSVHPISTSSYTDVDDTDVYGFDLNDVHGGIDADGADGADAAEDDADDADDEDAVVASWSPSVASFVVSPGLVPPPPPQPATFPRHSRFKSPSNSSSSASSPYTYSTAQRQQQRHSQHHPQHHHHQQRHHQHQHQKRQQRVRPPGLPPRMPAPAPRVAAMTPLSSAMLRHYIVEASPTLATNRAPRNPFLAALLPLAYTDDLVMHCILAIGGAHLSNRLTYPGASSVGIASGSSSSSSSSSSTAVTAYTPPDKAAAAALHDATMRHYTCVLRSLRGALRDLQPADSTQVLRVLAVLVLLSTYECLSWNVLDGGVFAHLRASRQLVAWLRNNNSSGESSCSDTHRLSSDERSLLGALLEIYAYLVLANRICPDGTTNNRSAVGEDTGIHDDEDFVADPGLLADHEGFGLLFSGVHGLFALIPPMARLAAIARDPAAASVPPPSPSYFGGIVQDSASATTSSMSVAAQVAALRHRALTWQLPAAFLAQASGDQDRIWQRAIGETYRHAVLIYLETIKRPGEPIDAVAIQRHIIAIGDAVIGADIVSSRFATILLWPLLIVGSVVAHDDERRFLADGLRSSPQATWASIKSAEVLEKMWERRDIALATQTPANGRRYYGPHGLAEIMFDTKVNVSVG